MYTTDQDLFRTLCGNMHRSGPCGRCPINTNSYILLRSIDFKSLIKLIESLTMPVSNGATNIRGNPIVPSCSRSIVYCNGGTLPMCSEVDPVDKTRLDVQFCIDMIGEWLAVNEPNAITMLRVAELYKILYSTDDSRNISALFYTLHVNYSNWRPSVSA